MPIKFTYTADDYIMETIVQSIVKTIFKYPKRKAVADAEGWYSYECLGAITDQMAEIIIRRAGQHGVDLAQRIEKGQSGLRVAVIMPRTKDFLLATIGIMKAGCPYVPIDPDFPIDRINIILKDCRSFQIVTTKEVLSKLRADKAFSYTEKDIILMEDVLEMPPSRTHMTYYDYSMLANEGLIIYTSGSTGQPKGVVHKMSIFPLMSKVVTHFHTVTSETCSATLGNFSFLAIYMDIYLPLTLGGFVYVVNDTERLDIRLLHDVLVRNRIEFCFMPTKLGLSMIDAYDDLPFKALIVAGEKLLNPPATDFKLIDTYGTTEIGAVICRLVNSGQDNDTLGTTLEGMTAYLLDEEGRQITEPGVTGEFCIVTPSAAIGYNNLPELTAEKFVDCPFAPGQLMFKTGDLMAYKKDGSLVFHGRKDYMVKLNGFRIELGEIESVLSKHEKMLDVACVMKTAEGGDNLCFYYTTKDGKRVAEEELKDFAAKKLAHYMVPSIYVHLDSMPRNANSKIDRLHLPEPVAWSQAEYVAPATPTEAKLEAVFRDLLGKERLSVTMSLYAQGLNSILAMQAIVKIAECLGLDLDYETVFKEENIRSLARFIDRDKARHKTSFRVYPKARTYPALKGMLGYMKAYQKGYRTNEVKYIIRIEGVKLPEMKNALQAVAKAHPSVKVRGAMEGRKFIIERDDETPMPYETLKLDFEPAGDWINVNCSKKVQIVGGYLVHFVLIETPSNGYLYCFGSHAALDASALQLLIHDFCRALVGEELTPEKYTIYDYALDEQRYFRSKAKKKDEDYYLALTKGLQENVLPYDKPIDGSDWCEAVCSVKFDKAAIDQYCFKHQLSQNSFFIAVFMQAFAKKGKWKETMISCLHSNRGSAELANVMNLTIRNFPIVSRRHVTLRSSRFHQQMQQEMHTIQDQVVRAMKMHFYDYYSVSGLGNKSPNELYKCTFLYYVGLKDLLMNPVKESNLLGRKVTFVNPMPETIIKPANDMLAVGVELSIDGTYEFKLKYNYKNYKLATIKTLARYVQDYIGKLLNE